MHIQLEAPLHLTKPGKRPYNEDYVFPDGQSSAPSKQENVFLVCDGVGGSEKGEVASRLVCTEVFNALVGRALFSDEDIQAAIAKAQRSIDEYIADHHIEQTMATTMTLVGFEEAGAVLAHVGDSRIYHVRGSQILYRTEDHSLVNELVAQSLITEEEARNHPQKNVITKAISGTDLQLVPSVHRTADIEPGDYFFLCTDGVLESIDDPSLVEVLSNSSISNGEKVELIDARCAANSKDNYSLYLIQIKAVD